jgi:flagellar basal-body rod protein FlgF
MDNTLYVGLSRQMALRREFDLVANNIANTETVGFKVESLMLAVKPERPSGGAFRGSSTAVNNAPINFVLDPAVARDFSQGPMKPTGNPFDLAIGGEGFFKIASASGERYTRDGRFSMDATGKLVTAQGDAVQGDGGDIILDPKAGQPTISEDGTVSQGGASLGKIALVRFADLAGLSKDGDGLYSNPSNQASTPAGAAKLAQGSVEGSNVQAISQITRMMEVQRAYESISNMMDKTSQMNSEAVDRLGKVQ